MPDEQTGGFEKLPLRHAYPFLATHGLQSEGQLIRLSNNTNRLKRARIAALLKKSGLLDAFVKEFWPHGADNNGDEVERLLRTFDRWTEEGGKDENGEQDDEDPGGEFVLEEHLRDYLEANVHLLEDGMTLWPVGEGQKAVEFSVDENNHRVDILARDKSGTPAVVELKVSRGHEKTIGQSLYYRARIKEILHAPKVRIVIVASEISPELKAAASEVADVSLFEYRISMTVKKV